MFTTIANQLIALGASKNWPQIRPNRYNAGGGIPLEAHLSRHETQRVYDQLNRTPIGYSERRNVSMAPMVRKSSSARAAYHRMDLEIERARAIGYWAGIGGAMPSPGALAANLPEAPLSSDPYMRQKIRY